MGGASFIQCFCQESLFIFDRVLDIFLVSPLKADITYVDVSVTSSSSNVRDSLGDWDH